MTVAVAPVGSAAREARAIAPPPPHGSRLIARFLRQRVGVLSLVVIVGLLGMTFMDTARFRLATLTHSAKRRLESISMEPPEVADRHFCVVSCCFSHNEGQSARRN